MRISDWSSDVCSSDLTQRHQRHMDATAAERGAQFGVAVLDQFDREARPQRRSNRLQQFCGRRADDAKFQFGLLTVALAPETVGGTKAAFQIAPDRQEPPARSVARPAATEVVSTGSSEW